MNTTRRQFLRDAAGLAGVAVVGGALSAEADPQDPPGAKKFSISLAAWSVHRLFFDGKLKQIDLPKLTREEFGLDGLELVNNFFPAPTFDYCNDLRKRAADHGVKILLIMCDSEGDMSHADAAVRRQAVRNHRKWLDAAALLGCHSIRCNFGNAAPGDAEAIRRGAESFAELADLAAADKLNVIIENHGGLSSDADSLMKVVAAVNKPNFGTLPDFGNFPKEADRYDSICKLMPAAKAVSAKCYAFNDAGDETTIDFARMMKIVLDAGYRGYVGIEYEGPTDELAGVKACRRLLERFQ
ncbi:MAG: sugar phosphate isomerase/epimerase [Phycisphaerae bacterium]|nr:MAG: sugar phosphate isomerase/epimerase [Planctomycetota bacterium]KAB2945413.1 MAG: sugar phosphate isomerase/epimerase [Phycisphaerae bacterium]MBE7457536.1 sugar phosphate isomerase/epimerase [Planctomycetia bacterium]MCK6464575.1 sugar phosphate isomerase/epimerase [Phycisphaerae bacterium]MCL4717338.1 sugar phosphate isomerase/epimerase [Phycisphaerae bacterium]